MKSAPIYYTQEGRDAMAAISQLYHRAMNDPAFSRKLSAYGLMFCLKKEKGIILRSNQVERLLAAMAEEGVIV